MIRSISYKWIISAVILLLIISAACSLWYQHTTAPYKQQAAKTEKLLQKTENLNKAEKPVAIEKSSTQVPEETTTVEKPETERPPATGKVELTQEHTETQALNDETADVPVSPYGFGPYPEIPPDYFHFHGEEVDPNFWTYDWGKSSELMLRVELKLWKQGIPTHGGIMSKGLFYPNYPNTIIVKWRTVETPFGTRRYSSLTQGSPETESYLRELRRQNRLIYEDEIPSHITVLEHKDAGIDPYEFLDLPK